MTKTIKIDAIHPRKHLITKNLVEKANSLNLPIRTWTIDDAKKALKMVRLNIESIITNNPKAILQAFDTKKTKITP